jgi:hypothetical protein
MLRKSVSAASAVLIFALTLSGVAAWHWRDQRVPQDDCANLACTSLEIYHAWEQQGVVAGVKALYGHSGWRPILLPNLTALLVFVFRGDAVRAASAALILAWMLLYAFTYRRFRLHLGRAGSAVCASFLTTLPAYFVYSCVFYAELPMLACLTAALFYAERFHASQCTSLGQGVRMGLWIGLALTIRPLEPIPAVMLLLLTLVASGLRHQTLRRNDLWLALAAASAVAALLLVRAMSWTFAWWGPVVVAAIMAGYAWIVRRARSRLNVAFATSTAVVLLVAGMWYAPRMRGLASWMWQCSFGDMIHLFKGSGNLSLMAASRMFFEQLGGWQLASVALLSAVVLLCTLRPRLLKGSSGVAPHFSLGSTSDPIQQEFNGPTRASDNLAQPIPQAVAGGFFMAIGAAQVVLVLVLAMVMEGSDLRRGLAGFYHLFIGLTVFSVAGGAMRLTWLRILPAAAFGLLQTALVWTAAGEHFLPDAGQWIYGKVGGYMWARLCEDRNRDTFREIERRIPPGSNVCCLSLAVHTFEARVFCPEALNLMALENHSPTQFRYPWNFRDLGEGYRQLASNGYGFVLLDTRDAASDVPKHKLQEPTSRLTVDMIRRSRDGSLAEVGWKVADSFRREDAALLILEPHVPHCGPRTQSDFLGTISMPPLR